MITKIVQLYTMLARGARQNDKNVGGQSDFALDAFLRVKTTIPSPGVPHHSGIPAWAWAAFISAIVLSAAAAYIGVYIGSTGTFGCISLCQSHFSNQAFREIVPGELSQSR